jgi:dUTP pyrophosphatase
VEEGSRIAQLIILPVASPELELADDLPPSPRGAGGFGSTGM